MDVSSFCSLSRKPPAKTEPCYLKEQGSGLLLFLKLLFVSLANELHSKSSEKEIFKDFFPPQSNFFPRLKSKYS